LVEVTQGVELGRQSDIVVEVRVEVGEDGERESEGGAAGGKGETNYKRYSCRTACVEARLQSNV
jgi:hypothetical protein